MDEHHGQERYGLWRGSLYQDAFRSIELSNLSNLKKGGCEIVSNFSMN